MPTSIADLDEDVLCRVFSHLPARQLLTSVQTCLRWRELEREMETELWQPLVCLLQPSHSAGYLSRQVRLNWKTRYRMLQYRMLQPQAHPHDEFARRLDTSKRLVGIKRDFEFAIDLCHPETGNVLVSTIVVPRSDLVTNPLIVSTNFGAEYHLSTDLAFTLPESVSLDPLWPTIGLRPLDLHVGRLQRHAFGSVQANVYVKRRDDNRLANFASIRISFWNENGGFAEVENNDPTSNFHAFWTSLESDQEMTLDYVHNWDSLRRPMATCPLPGSGEYGRLQPEVHWVGGYELACGFEVECVQESGAGQGQPNKLALGFFLLPLRERDPDGQPFDTNAFEPEVEPFTARLLDRVLRGQRPGAPGDPKANEPYMEWF